MKKNEEKLTFEQAMERLETIVSELEKGEAPLDESLSYFEEGVKLTKICSEILDEATLKVKTLTGDFDTDFKDGDTQEK